jgi:hypothetical protein
LVEAKSRHRRAEQPERGVGRRSFQQQCLGGRDGAIFGSASAGILKFESDPMGEGRNNRGWSFASILPYLAMSGEEVQDRKYRATLLGLGRGMIQSP